MMIEVAALEELIPGAELIPQYRALRNRMTANRIEDIFKKSDRFTEDIEEQLVNEEKEVDSAVEEMFDWPYASLVFFFSYFSSKNKT